MHKYLTIFILFCLCTSTYAEVLDDVKNNIELKAKGNALANYDVCKSLATQSGDKVMAYYYDEMHRLTITETTLGSQADKQLQVEIIESEYDKALSILKKVNSAGFYQLCLNRFDSVSRQYYTTRLATKLEKAQLEKTKLEKSELE
ncbi:hypothetical protein [Psychromonas sp. SP041]|uniref:hypothetical protein n=1 Tax=Psychromonas sp. SP041 TaxID=1365007 RepID=UPI000472A9D5|nr:hypothetical protein [Psychromonas sp. SP041]